MFASKSNMERVISDYDVPRDADPDWLEKCFPCVFSDLRVPNVDPLYGNCYFLMIPRAPQRRVADTAANETVPPTNCTLAINYLKQRATDPKGPQRLQEFTKLDQTPAECMVEFTSLDENAFSLDMGDALSKLYKSDRVLGDPRTAWEPYNAAMEATHSLLDKIAYRLMTCLVVMNEMPFIRYSTTPGACLRGMNSQPLTQVLATKVQEHLELYQRTHLAFSPLGWTRAGNGAPPPPLAAGGGGGGGVDAGSVHLDANVSASDMQPEAPQSRATVLIVDRVDDLIGALLHHDSYASAVVDFLGAEVPGPSKITLTLERGEETVTHEMEYQLDRADRVWTKLRDCRASKEKQPLIVSREPAIVYAV